MITIAAVNTYDDDEDDGIEELNLKQTFHCLSLGSN
jgi:hypothetical protein